CDRTLPALSALARQGSGSASRSLWGGWVHWRLGTAEDGQDSHGEPLAPADHWDVRVVVAMVGTGPKKVGSTTGMRDTARTCPYYDRWVETAPADVQEGMRAIRSRDLERLGRVMEWSTLKMHATMMTSEPSIRYWKPETVAAMEVVEDLRARGTGAWYTMDAGPNVKVLCAAADAPAVEAALRTVVPRVDSLGVGGDARLC
ncbi:MAG: diphosphomevalonate decarboxylase, partial [Myxococcota bacterium]|nr:diphosphomevalonate decarboxylase [Myxococcota bacterium]